MPSCASDLHRVEHLADQLRVERGGRFVEEHELRVHGQRAGDGDALLLAAGELRRVGVDLVRQADLLEERAAHVFGLPAGQLLDAHGRLDDVAERAQVREEVEALEDHADRGPLARDLGLAVLDEAAVLLAVADELAVDVDAPGLEGLEVVDAAQQGRLAGAAGAEEDDDFAAGDVDRDAAQDLGAAEALVGVEDAEHGASVMVGILYEFGSRLSVWLPVRRHDGLGEDLRRQTHPGLTTYAGIRVT